MCTRWRLTLLGPALLLAVLPLPDGVVEAAYTNGVYPFIQAVVTTVSNLVPIALFDVLVVGVVVGWLALLLRDVRRRPWRTTLGRLVRRTATLAAVLYLAFLAVWGLNYRRVPLEDRLQLSYRAVTPAAAERLARTAVTELNRLYPARQMTLGDGTGETMGNTMTGRATGAPGASLVPALASVQAQLEAPRPIVPGRPKRTLLDWYFRAASVDGMTDPFFLETLTLSTLLPIERPIVIAHEWAHLAGYADEGEANFIGWLACLRGDEAARYSAWLFLYSETASALDDAQRRAVAAGLSEGPRADLRAIAQRVQAHVVPLVSTVGWGLYVQYLKANGIERGRRSYTDVVRLVLGTSLGQQAIPPELPGSPGALTPPGADAAAAANSAPANAASPTAPPPSSMPTTPSRTP